MSPIVISIAVFCGVAALVGAVAFIMRGDKEAEVEERLSVLTSGGGKKHRSKAEAAQYQELLKSMRGEGVGTVERFVSRYLNLRLLFEQANVSMSVANFLIICGGLGMIGLLLPALGGLSIALAPLMSAFLAALPFVWLLVKRKQRLKKFAAQLPEALELIARALRAGHSLASGFNLVAQEMSEPI